MSVEIRRAPTIRLMQLISSGTILADGSEQKILEYHGLATIGGYIDLSSMEDGDKVIIRAYTKIEKDGEFKLYKSETFMGRQTEPALYILPRMSGYSFKITIQQISGVPKTFKYLFMSRI